MDAKVSAPSAETAAEVLGVLWDITDSRETAPSVCFKAERSCCFAAFSEAIANSSVTRLIAHNGLVSDGGPSRQVWKSAKAPAQEGIDRFKLFVDKMHGTSRAPHRRQKGWKPHVMVRFVNSTTIHFCPTRFI